MFVRTKTPWTGLYEIIPGLAVCLVPAMLVSNATHRRDEDVEREFDDAVRLTHAAQEEMATR